MCPLIDENIEAIECIENYDCVDGIIVLSSLPRKIKTKDNFIEIYNKLRNGEKVECEVCQKGYLVTPYDYKTSHYFECSHCKAMLNID